MFIEYRVRALKRTIAAPTFFLGSWLCPSRVLMLSRLLLLLAAGLWPACAFQLAAGRAGRPLASARLSSCRLPPRPSRPAVVMGAEESRRAALDTGVEMEYRTAGDVAGVSAGQKPPVVFIHGSFHGLQSPAAPILMSLCCCLFVGEGMYVDVCGCMWMYVHSCGSINRLQGE